MEPRASRTQIPPHLGICVLTHFFRHPNQQPATRFIICKPAVGFPTFKELDAPAVAAQYFAPQYFDISAIAPQGSFSKRIHLNGLSLSCSGLGYYQRRRRKTLHLLNISAQAPPLQGSSHHQPFSFRRWHGSSTMHLFRPTQKIASPSSLQGFQTPRCLAHDVPRSTRSWYSYLAPANGTLVPEPRSFLTIPMRAPCGVAVYSTAFSPLSPIPQPST
ncbi:hypothetical protein FB45DRAFT_889552 [Roridomyces roridus]|uniref:Uncharacterized protein n=1 Tax=Roridomyces roridus TaxID=1738132 RepID=A0AAD7FZ85_9AGAR|nr:hypothetical protein FB45DRAFT_889552 [Roridomyces roridus]